MVACSITPECRPLLGQCSSWSSLDASRLREPISYFGVEPREMMERCLVVILLRPLPWCLRLCQRWGHQTAILRIIPEITPYTADLPPGLDIPPSSNFSQALSKRLGYASWLSSAHARSTRFLSSKVNQPFNYEAKNDAQSHRCFPCNTTKLCSLK